MIVLSFKIGKLNFMLIVVFAAMELALSLEKLVNEKLLNLHSVRPSLSLGSSSCLWYSSHNLVS